MADNTVTQTNIQGFAPVVAPYAESVLGRAGDLMKRNYKSYADWAKERNLSGDQVAAFDKLQTDAFAGAGKLGQDPYSTASAQGIEALAQKAGAYNYNPTQFGNQFQAPDAYKPGSFDYQRVAADAQSAPTMDAAQTGYNPQLQNYQMGPAERVNAQGVSVGDINAAQMGPAERVDTQSFAQPGSADAYMSPYMQNVVEMQKREAQRQSGIQGTQQQAQAAQAGAFGGGRDAIMRAERERNLAQQMGDIQATGSQAAFQNAQQQFNTEQQARLAAQQSNQQAGLTTGIQNLNAQQQTNVQNEANRLQASGMNAQQAMQAALANQQAGLTTGSQNLAANLGVQQLGTQTGTQTSLANLSNQQQAAVQNQAAKLQMQGMSAQQALQAALANQQAGMTTQQQQEQSRQFGAGQGMQAAGLSAQYGLAAQQEAERSKQFGANLGLEGLKSGMQGYGALGSQGQNLYGQTTGNLQLQNAFGTQKQQQGQNMIDVNQRNYAEEQNYPYKQVGFMSDVVRGAPVGNLGSTMTQPAPSLVSQVAGLGGAAVTGAKLFGKAKGGQIKQRGAGLADLAMYQMSRG
jgi:hypothetical protein